MTPPPLRKPLAQALLGGEEPDPRFTLANERTFLAWARTALALLGGGIAVETFAGQAFAPWLRLSITLSLLALSLLLSAHQTFARINATMDRTVGGRPSPREGVLVRLISFYEQEGNAAEAQRYRDELG